MPVLLAMPTIMTTTMPMPMPMPRKVPPVTLVSVIAVMMLPWTLDPLLLLVRGVLTRL